MSDKDKNTIRMLSVKLSAHSAKTITLCAVLMLISVLLHDGDHIRQAINWGYTIPASLLVLNLTVYILPVISIFLSRTQRFSATLVTAVAGVFTSAAFLIIHLFGSASGLWGVWNYSYFKLIQGVTYNGVFYQGVDWISWVFLFEVPALCLPSSVCSFLMFLKLKKENAVEE